MTAEADTERAELRALRVLMESVIPDYATDPLVQRRLGRVLSDIAARVPVWPSGERPW
jgi:hypothetical protein